MQVSHVITRLIVGGAQENTVATVLGLHRHPDFRVDLISGATAEAEAQGTLKTALAREPGLLTVVPELVRPLSPLRDLIAFFKLRKRFRERRPDIVHTHSGKAGILGRLAARAAGVPYIIHTIHGPSFGPFQGKAANLLFRTAEKIAGAVTTHFIGVAHAMCEQYLQAGIGRAGQHSVIRSGFELAPFLQAADDPALRRRLGLEPGDFVIGKVARLVPLKGHEELLEAAPEILTKQPRAKFLLVGDGPLRPRFERLARERSIAERIVYTGLVPPERVPELIGIMDVLVHLSRREGLPRALPQALAAGKPVVAADADGAKEVCLDGRTGYLIPPGDRRQVVEKICRLAQNPELRTKLGRQGRDLVRKDFTTEAMVAEIIELYRRLPTGPESAAPAA